MIMNVHELMFRKKYEIELQPLMTWVYEMTYSLVVYVTLSTTCGKKKVGLHHRNVYLKKKKKTPDAKEN